VIRANSRLVISLAALTMTAPAADGQMMRQAAPMTHVESIPRDAMLTQEQWINAIVDRWTGPQRKSWQTLNPKFRAWVSDLLWARKNARRPSVDPGLQIPAFHVPSSCEITGFVAPPHSVAESMEYWRNALPDINWNAWETVEPAFRGTAEWEMSVEHVRAQLSKAEREWWDVNAESIRSCVAAAPAAWHESRADKTIDRRADVEKGGVGPGGREPEPVKQEVRQQLSDAAAVDKYIAQMDGLKP
jgi:hypothetical protein